MHLPPTMQQLLSVLHSARVSEPKEYSEVRKVIPGELEGSLAYRVVLSLDSQLDDCVVDLQVRLAESSLLFVVKAPESCALAMPILPQNDLRALLPLLPAPQA